MKKFFESIGGFIVGIVLAAVLIAILYSFVISVAYVAGLGWFEAQNVKQKEYALWFESYVDSQGKLPINKEAK